MYVKYEFDNFHRQLICLTHKTDSYLCIPLNINLTVDMENHINELSL